MRKRCLFFLLVLLTGSLYGQQKHIPWNHALRYNIESSFYTTDKTQHTSFKPYLESDFDYIAQKDSVLNFMKPDTGFSGFRKKMFRESLVIIEADDYRFTIDPLMDFQFGNELREDSDYSDTTSFYVNTRGFRIQGDIGEQFSFESFFFENQAFFPTYLRDYVESSGVVPGQGRTKVFKETGFDYAFSEAYLNYTHSEYFSVSAGHGRQFIGEGYRSMLLSDFAFNYPYLRFKTTFWDERIQYINSFTYMQSLDRIPVATTPEALFQPKLTSFQYLDIKIHKRLYLGLMESVVWRIWDEQNGSRPMDYNFFNPIPFVHTIVNKESNNVFHGLNIKFIPFDRVVLYGQAMMQNTHYSRNFPREGIAYQAGLKIYDLPIENLFFRAEYNVAAPFTYFAAQPLQNYAHYNQALAHPFGANFNEFIVQLNYRYKRVFFNGHLLMATRQLEKVSEEEPGSAGSNIFMPLEDIQEETTPEELMFVSLQAGFLLNPTNNLMLKIGVDSRVSKWEEFKHENLFLTVGLSANLFNRYYDL